MSFSIELAKNGYRSKTVVRNFCKINSIVFAQEVMLGIPFFENNRYYFQELLSLSN